MPIYEYECTQCGQVEEAIQKFSDKPLKKCPHCSGKLHRLISHSSFHLKGTGWYVTDYADKPRKKSKTSQGDKKPSPASEKTSNPSVSNKKKTD